MNLLSFYTLYKKEVLRFIKVYNQTLIAPLINALLLLSVFSLAIGNRVSEIQGVSFKHFIIPGLVMMTVVQQAFANSSSTLTFGKVIGNIIDLLIPPLSPKEISLAITLAGITRGIISGLVIIFAIYIIGAFFDESLQIPIHNIGLAIFYLFFSAMMLSLLGLIAGIYADSFDQISAITSFIITPLSFLSGTFYSIKNLPEIWQTVNLYNPFFYMIDGFRYSVTGHNDASIQTGVTVLLIFNLVLYLTAYFMIKKGYRIKS